VIVACEPSTEDTTLHWRDRDPKYPESSPDSEDWTLDNLTDIKKRLWSNYRGDSVDQSDVVDDIAEGVEIARWRDDSDGLRHVYATFGDGQTTPDKAPILALDAWLEHKGIRFNTGRATGPYQALRSLQNSSIAPEFADQQRTIVPGYTDSAWALFIVARLSQSAPDATPTARWLFAHDRDNASATSKFHGLFVNASSAGGFGVITPSSGRLWWYTGLASTNGDGTASAIREGRFDIRQDNGTNPDATTTNKGQIVIVTMVMDGNVTTAKSVFRINGSPIDAFSSAAQFTLAASYLGLWRDSPGAANPDPSSGVSNLLGDLLEVIALDRRSRTDATQNVVTFDNIQYNTLPQSQTINDVTLIEGMLAHRYGVQINLPFGTAAANNYPHPFGITGAGQDRVAAPPNQGATAPSTAQGLANKSWGAVVKYDAKGKIVWCANEMELISGNRSGGYGYAVALNSSGNIYSLGPVGTGTGSQDNATTRLIIDQGTTFSIQTLDGAWSSTLTGPATTHPRIDVDEFAGGARAPGVVRKAESIREDEASRTILLSVDRLDYTKGLPQRLDAFSLLLEREPDLRGRITLVQFVIPSRGGIAQYTELKREIERRVGELNGRFTRSGWVPVHHNYRAIPREKLLAYYRAADVALVSPLKDGMNLVCKEYCASRVDGDGVLVLSEFAGAAAQLGIGALLVNPWDTAGFASAIARAVRMPEDERRGRMRKMRRAVREHDVSSWADAFLHTAYSREEQDERVRELHGLPAD
jgi:glycosyltransferase involved in cell wall biosynthesis